MRPGDTIDFVGNNGGVQRMAAASRILANYDIHVESLVGIAGPIAGRYNNIGSIALIGSARNDDGSFAFNEPTSVLQWGLQKLDLTSASGSRGNVSYQNMTAEDGMYIPHNPPNEDRWIPHRDPDNRILGTFILRDVPGGNPIPEIVPDRRYFEFLRTYVGKQGN